MGALFVWNKGGGIVSDFRDNLLRLRVQKTRRKAAELEYRKLKLERSIKMFDSFMKVLVAVVVFHGLCCVTASYVFAWHGIMEPLESLSETIAREIAAPVVTYGLTKTIENISKYNDWIERFLYWKYKVPYTDFKEEQEDEQEEASEPLG